MVWIGTMNLTRTVDQGNFYCPTCGTSANYRLRSRRPFLTIYFIPCVPVGGAEQFVLCEGCKSSWDTSVLGITKEAHEAAQWERFRDEALRTAILVTVADGTITDEEIAMLIRVSHELLERPIDRDELGSLCASASRLGVKAPNYILSNRHRWTHQQRVIVLKAAFLAASAEGDLNKAQLDMLAKLKDLLGLTDEEYEGAIEEAISLG